MLNIEEIEKLLPHRYPFLMLDRVIEIKEGEFIRAYKNISMDAEYFKGHFPEEPIFPGAYIAEAMAQAACILIQKSIKDLNAKHFYVTNAKLRFFKLVIPGDRMDVYVKSVKMAKVGGIFKVEASVDKGTVAKGDMTFACK